jgi:hypothetical protein
LLTTSAAFAKLSTVKLRAVLPGLLLAGLPLAPLTAQRFTDGWNTIPTAKGPPMPRAKNGKPDLSGYYQHRTGAPWDILDHKAEYGIPAAPGIVEGNTIPYQPWALQEKERRRNNLQDDPEAHCHMSGVPRVSYAPFPMKIVQTPDEAVMVYENVHTWRIIPLNAKHQNGVETWSGDSVGHWEGDTLVVDVTGFNDRTWFDMAGNFHSNALHVVERYQPIDRNTIWYQATIEDPKVFTRPWRMRFPLYRQTDPLFTLLEFECIEGERDLQHYKIPPK